VTEAEWLYATDPDALLYFLDGIATPRQFMLFSCACCRHSWHLLHDERSRKTIEAAERVADGDAPRELLIAAGDAGEQAVSRFLARDGQADRVGASSATGYLVTANVARGAAEVSQRVAEAISWYAARQRSWPDLEIAKKVRLTAKATERENQADLLRHILGNPFRPVPTFRPWTASVTSLAQAFYRGEDCLFALHDALLDAGCTELAVHFAQPEHPKGCWLLDLLRVPPAE
jgi:hypothetical protein